LIWNDPDRENYGQSIPGGGPLVTFPQAIKSRLVAGFVWSPNGSGIKVAKGRFALTHTLTHTPVVKNPNLAW
jgi:hypothetical protein